VDGHLLHAAPELLPLAVYYQVVTTAGRSQPRSEWMQHMDRSGQPASWCSTSSARHTQHGRWASSHCSHPGCGCDLLAH
jgi:hypothetical protein